MLSVLMIVISLLNPTNSQEIQLEKKSVIKFGWGMMFDYYGQMLHGLNKYNLIVGVKVPTVSDLNLQIPYMLQPSVCKNFPKNIAYLSHGILIQKHIQLQDLFVIQQLKPKAK